MTLLYTRTVYVWTKNWLDEATSEKIGSISGGENIAIQIVQNVYIFTNM